MSVKRGRVKWYSEEKGFGLVSPDNGGNETFIHTSQVKAAGYDTIYQNTKVSYIEKTFNNKNQAFNLKIL